MINAYIKDNKLIKIIHPEATEEVVPEGAELIVAEFDINDVVSYENGEIKLFKNTSKYSQRVSELSGVTEKTPEEEEELNYLLSL